MLLSFADLYPGFADVREVNDPFARQKDGKKAHKNVGGTDNPTKE